MFYPLLMLFLKSPKQGAQTSIYCAVAEELEGTSGRHFKNCRMSDISLPAALDSEKLWDVSMTMTKVE